MRIQLKLIGEKRSEEKMPFFSVFNLMTSHQSRSMVWSHEKFKNEIQSKLREDQIHHPHKIKIPPTTLIRPLFRKPWPVSMTA